MRFSRISMLRTPSANEKGQASFDTWPEKVVPLRSRCQQRKGRTMSAKAGCSAWSLVIITSQFMADKKGI
jgi:hypothetical protein